MSKLGECSMNTRKKASLLGFFFLFLIGGVVGRNEHGALEGLLYGAGWFTALILVPKLTVDMVSRKWRSSPFRDVVLWSLTALFSSAVLVTITHESITELKPVALGIVLAFAWEFIRRGYPSKIEERIDSLLQPNIEHHENNVQNQNSNS